MNNLMEIERVDIDMYTDPDNPDDFTDECGCCGYTHVNGWYGDCRSDSAGYSWVEEAEARLFPIHSIVDRENENNILMNRIGLRCMANLERAGKLESARGGDWDIARMFAAQFDFDDMKWRDESGINLLDTVADHANHSSCEGGELDRFEFVDGSAIVVSGSAWDIGFTAEECRDPANIQRVADSDAWSCSIEFVMPESL